MMPQEIIQVENQYFIIALIYSNNSSKQHWKITSSDFSTQAIRFVEFSRQQLSCRICPQSISTKDMFYLEKVKLLVIYDNCSVFNCRLELFVDLYMRLAFQINSFDGDTFCIFKLRLSVDRNDLVSTEQADLLSKKFSELKIL